MGLRLKFNLVLIVVFLAGFGAAGFMSRQLLQENAREEVLRNARLMMDTALSVRAYTVRSLRMATWTSGDPVSASCVL